MRRVRRIDSVFSVRLSGLAGCVLLLLASIARGDILMIDLNGNPSEKRAAELAAASRHEQVISLGAIPDGDRHRQLVQERESAMKKLFANEQKLSQDAKKQLNERIDKLSQQIDNFQQYKEIRLENDLARLAAEKRNITTIIISGHHGQGGFFGYNGKLRAEEIKRALAAHPELAAKIRTLILAGCYSATPGAIKYNWRDLVPNLALVAGYDALAPKGATADSPQYISEILNKEAEFLAAKDKRTLEVLFKKIKGIHNINAAICANDIFVDRQGSMTMGEIQAKCEAAVRSGEIDEINKALDCFESAEGRCENPPANTQTGELRQLYEKANALAQCPEVFEAHGKRTPDRDRLLRLVFFANVLRNSQANHRTDLATLDQNLAKLGFQQSELFGSLPNFKRKDLLAKLASAQQKLSQLQARRDVMSGPLGPTVAQAQVQLTGLEQTVGQLLPTCTPDTWVEGSSRERSKCLGTPQGGSLARQSARGLAAAIELQANQMLEQNAVDYRSAKQESDRLKEMLSKSSDDTKTKIQAELRSVRLKMTEAANTLTERANRKSEEEFEKEISRRRNTVPGFRDSADEKAMSEMLEEMRETHRRTETAGKAAVEEMMR